MKNKYNSIPLKKVPILRPLLGLMTGILIQYHFDLSLLPFFILASSSLLIILFFKFKELSHQFSNGGIIGFAFILLFVAIGSILGFTKNGTHDKLWVGNYYKSGMPVLLTLEEPLVAKPKSFKAMAKVEAVFANNQWQPVEGKALLYFKAGDTLEALQYGTQLITRTPLASIENSGNPGCFDYKEHCSFQNIYYQCFLGASDYTVLKSTSTNFLTSLIIKTRVSVLSILKKNIPGKNELSVGEALLIGYRDDLDKNLLQAYNNTGVVHIIIISGLRMGMIYVLLLFLLSPFKNKKWYPVVKPISIIVVLWGFCLIAGAAPSVTRSTIMFTFVVIGESFGRRTNIYNNLALSALVILLINPFSLWDAGFQLSYAAVISIILFASKIDRWFYFQNKILRKTWGLFSVTMAAQILTLPLILFHFHQLPTMFLFTNLLAVPVSCIILYGELLLVATSFIPTLARLLGQVDGWLLGKMNDYISNVNALPFSVWGGLNISLLQVLLLYGSITGIAGWLIYKKNGWVLIGLSFVLLFVLIRSEDIIAKLNQKKLIVYNIPQHYAIDLMDGSECLFVGDDLLKDGGELADFHLKPSRILNRVNVEDSVGDISVAQNLISIGNKTILIINKPFGTIKECSPKLKLDAIIFTGNPRIGIKEVSAIFDCEVYVIDASNPKWKTDNWINEAVSLHQKLYSVANSGAFVLDL